MGLFSWLAEVLDTQVRVDRARIASLQATLNERDEEIIALSEHVDHIEGGVNNLSARLAEAAKTITELRDHRKRLREQLIIARAYVIDASDDVDDAIANLSPRSKKREPLLATQASINTDLKNFADLLTETSK